MVGLVANFRLMRACRAARDLPREEHDRDGERARISIPGPPRSSAPVLGQVCAGEGRRGGARIATPESPEKREARLSGASSRRHHPHVRSTHPPRSLHTPLHEGTGWSGGVYRSVETGRIMARFGSGGRGPHPRNPFLSSSPALAARRPPVTTAHP